MQKIKSFIKSVSVTHCLSGARLHMLRQTPRQSDCQTSCACYAGGLSGSSCRQSRGYTGRCYTQTLSCRKSDCRVVSHQHLWETVFLSYLACLMLLLVSRFVQVVCCHCKSAFDGYVLGSWNLTDAALPGTSGQTVGGMETTAVWWTATSFSVRTDIPDTGTVGKVRKG